MNQLPRTKHIVSPYAPKILASLQCQGNTNNCGPFTTATIVNAMRGTEILGDKLAEEMNEVSWNGIIPIIRRLPDSATFPWGMVDIFMHHGLRASWSVFTSPEKLRKMLAAGDILMPVIGSWNPAWAHVMTFIAWNGTKGYGFANTQYPAKEIFWVPDTTFVPQWRNLANLLVRIERET